MKEEISEGKGPVLGKGKSNTLPRVFLLLSPVILSGPFHLSPKIWNNACHKTQSRINKVNA